MNAVNNVDNLPEENLTYAEATNRRFRREIARTAGWICAIAGGFFLLIGMVSLLGHSSKAASLNDLFGCTSVFFTVSWLLLRFSAGLWPFGKLLFR